MTNKSKEVILTAPLGGLNSKIMLKTYQEKTGCRIHVYLPQNIYKIVDKQIKLLGGRISSSMVLNLILLWHRDNSAPSSIDEGPEKGEFPEMEMKRQINLRPGKPQLEYLTELATLRDDLTVSEIFERILIVFDKMGGKL